MSQQTKHTKPITIQSFVLPMLLVVVVVLFNCFPTYIEQYYSNGIYHRLSQMLRRITAFIPISVGDIFYAIVVILFIKKLLQIIRLAWQKQLSWKGTGRATLLACKTLLWLFIWFHVLWGFNYHRLGIATQMQLYVQDYSKEEAESIVCDLVDKLNHLRPQISQDTMLPAYPFKTIVQTAGLAYQQAASTHPFITYTPISVKQSLYSPISHYVGFTGYYNPFSAEAQVSTDLPNVLMPYIACHEIAHQIGYASEDEANFVGYLACSQSADPYFQYSVYLDLYKYAARSLLFKDMQSTHGWELDKLVRKDLLNIRRFFQRKDNKISPVMSTMYNQYLLANQQAKGIDSYDDVVALLIAYKKKYGKI